MLSRLVICVIASFCSFALALEAIGVEAPGPGAEGQSIGDRRVSSSASEIIVRLPDGPSVRVGGKLAVLLKEGYAAVRSKRYDRAISSFTAALEANPDNNIASHIHYNRGLAYSLIGNNDKAIDDYSVAIQQNPKHVNPYINRGIEYSKKRNYKLAFRDATMAIQLNRKHANAYHNRGAYYAETGNFDKAIADLSEAIRFSPRSATTFDGRAQVYEDLEQFGKAVADYDQVIRIAPKDADDYAVRGRAYFKKGNYKEAASAFEKAVQLSPNNDFALGGLAWFRATCPDASLRNGKEAIRMSIRACELSKWKEPYRIEALAAVHAETGDFDAAVKYQTQAMKLKSTYGPILKESRERLALYRDHKPWRAKPLTNPFRS
jgi:tetratricopeptide (TPR) repeat protein